MSIYAAIQFAGSRRSSREMEKTIEVADYLKSLLVLLVRCARLKILGAGVESSDFAVVITTFEVEDSLARAGL
jgi:hypothetical protein